jgi:hypothetical protein
MLCIAGSGARITGVVCKTEDQLKAFVVARDRTHDDRVGRSEH